MKNRQSQKIREGAVLRERLYIILYAFGFCILVAV